jgi:hypothetical protein
VDGSTRETILCKRNIVLTKTDGRKVAVDAAAVLAAATDTTLNINIITTNSFLKRKLVRRC